MLMAWPPSSRPDPSRLPVASMILALPSELRVSRTLVGVIGTSWLAVNEVYTQSAKPCSATSHIVPSEVTPTEPTSAVEITCGLRPGAGGTRRSCAPVVSNFAPVVSAPFDNSSVLELPLLAVSPVEALSALLGWPRTRLPPAAAAAGRAGGGAH